MGVLKKKNKIGKYIRKNAASLSMIAAVLALSAIINGNGLWASSQSLPQAVLTGGRHGTGAPGISASSAIVIDAEDGSVLYEKICRAKGISGEHYEDNDSNADSGNSRRA